MADQFESNARSPHPDSEVDDPLAELARIIGYERPSEASAPENESSDSAEFDLEAELMRELDVPLAPSSDEIEDVEADEALDVMLAGSEFDQDAGEIVPDASQPVVANEPVEAPVADAPEAEAADFMAVEGRSSTALMEAIENESPFAHEDGRGADETGIDDDWMMTLDADDIAPEADADEIGADSQSGPQAVDAGLDVSPVQAAEPVAPQVADAADPLDDDVFADMARFDLPSVVQNDLPKNDISTNDAVTTSNAVPADAKSVSEEDEASLDFEEYLSTELDVFEHEVALGGEAENDVAGEQDDEAELAVEAALDALNDSTLDDEVAVFDDAAEELLAAIGDDAKSNVENAPAGNVSHEAEDGWSLDSLEEAAAVELDDELGDMFGLPERAAGTSADRSEAPDELELDLEQLLADSFDDDDKDLAGPVEAIATAAQSEQVLADDDWLSAKTAPQQTVSHDEMSDAFLELAADIDDGQVELAPSVTPSVDNSSDAARAVQPEQSDWLDGFETSEHVVEPDASLADEADYYFDAGLISEADETVEVVADIDVPVLHHDDPQPVDPDYEAEIEREFAGIAERADSLSEERPADVAGSAFAAVEDWNRGETPPQTHEVSDEYIALERELGVGTEDDLRTSAAGGYGADFPADNLDINEELAVASSYQDNRSRAPVVALAVLGVALLAGVGAFGWSMLSGGGDATDGGPRIIRADKDPVKVLPENPGGVTVPNQDKAVYDRVAGGTGASTGQPALVNSAEEPVDVVQRTLDPEILPLEGRADVSDKSEERLSAEASGTETASNDTAAPVVSPRKVRTMIVKPDGSIVAREVEEPEVAAAVDTPQIQASPEAQADTPLQPAENADLDGQQLAQTVEPVQEQPAEAEAPANEGTVAPVRVVTTQPIRPVANAPVPLGRPADQPVNVVGTVTQGGRVDAAPANTAAPAATQPVEVARAPATPVANPGGYYVQIASQPTVEGAQSSWRTLSNRYSSVLGGQSVDIQRADIPGKGVFHRVRVPAGPEIRQTHFAVATRLPVEAVLFPVE